MRLSFIHASWVYYMYYEHCDRNFLSRMHKAILQISSCEVFQTEDMLSRHGRIFGFDIRMHECSEGCTKIHYFGLANLQW